MITIMLFSHRDQIARAFCRLPQKPPLSHVTVGSRIDQSARTRQKARLRGNLIDRSAGKLYILAADLFIFYHFACTTAG